MALGPVGSSEVWTPFAAWNQQQAVFPLPLAIQGTVNGFDFSKPPVFDSGNRYTPALPNDNTQSPAQYYGGFHHDFSAAPSNDGANALVFTLPPHDTATAFTKLEGFSDWAATVSLADDTDNSMTLTFASGSPLAFLEFSTDYGFFKPTSVSPIKILCPYDLPPVVKTPVPGADGKCPDGSSPPCKPQTLFAGGAPTYLINDPQGTYPVTWITQGIGKDTTLDMYMTTDMTANPVTWQQVAQSLSNNGLYQWTPTSSQVTNGAKGQFLLVPHGTPVTTGIPAGPSALSVAFVVVAQAGHVPPHQPDLRNVEAHTADPGLFGTQYLKDAQVPLRYWFPVGFEPLSPAGVNILVGGQPISQSNDLHVGVNLGGGSAGVTFTTVVGQSNQQTTEGLRQAMLADTEMTGLVDIGPVEEIGISESYQFKLTAKDPNVTLTMDDVTVSPTGGEQTVVNKATSPGGINQPEGPVLGITITGVATSTTTNGVFYRSSYALVAPGGAKWTIAAGGADVVCDFASASSRTIAIVAMPDVSEAAYANYDTPGTGAAAILQGFWNMMGDYVYGCPLHMTGGVDDGTGTLLGPNDGKQFTPLVTTSAGEVRVTTEYHYNLSYPLAQPGGAAGTLFGLLPHQWRDYAGNTATPLSVGGQELTYTTVMGKVKLGAFNGTGTLAFTTTHTFPGLLAAIPNAALVTGQEQLQVYDYPNNTAQQTDTTTLIDQMTQDIQRPVWSADNFGATSPGHGGSQAPADTFIPVPPTYQQNWGIDSYDWGKLICAVADLIQPAFLLGDKEAAQEAVSQLRAQLGQWLSGALVGADSSTPFPPGVEEWQSSQGNTTFAGATGLDSNQQFLFYDEQWASFIPYPTAFYADNLLNDHHFHYGYWLRAAAQLVLAQLMGLDPKATAGTSPFIADYGATINLIIKDIANPLRGDQGKVGDQASQFPNGPATPFLRYFDGYFGHAWASGLPLNILNQESHSEAMSAWTGVILWGQLTGDDHIRDLGIWMYTLSRFSFYEYWMDCAQNDSSASALFPEGSPENIEGDAYNQSIKGALDSADVGFCTQVYNSYLELVSDFGMDPLYLTGIQWLPFHGGSLYLSSTDPAVKDTLKAVYNWAKVNSQHQWDNRQQPLPFYQPTIWAASWEPVASNQAALLGEGSAQHLWSGLEAAVGSKGTTTPHDGWKPLGGQTISYSYYWIHNISELGWRDETVSADSPYAVKFVNGDGKATYVAWNLTAEPQTVTFSDNHSISDIPAFSMYPTYPHQPANVLPAHGAALVSLTPNLKSSAFSAPSSGADHNSSQWQISATPGNFSAPVFDSGTDTSSLTQIAIAPGTLTWTTDYYWRVRHQHVTGAWSGWSQETRFGTLMGVERTVGSGGGTVETPDQSVAVYIPSGALAGDATVILEIARSRDQAPAPVGFSFGSTFFTVSVSAHPDEAVTVMARYSVADVQAANGSAERLILSRYDDALGTWVVLPTSVDAAAGTLTATTDKLSQWAVLVRETVAKSPTAAFGASPTSGNAPLNVVFTDQSTGDITSWEWDFDGDGITDSTDQHPSYTYTVQGQYSVSLKVAGPGGSDTETKAGLIVVTKTGEVGGCSCGSAKANTSSTEIAIGWTVFGLCWGGGYWVMRRSGKGRNR